MSTGDDVIYPQLNELSVDQIERTYQALASVIAERVPDLDVERSAVRDLVIQPAAVIATWFSAFFQKNTHIPDLNELRRHPEKYRRELDRLGELFSLKRLSAAPAVVRVHVWTSDNIPLVFPANSRFTTSSGRILINDNTIYVASSDLSFAQPDVTYTLVSSPLATNKVYRFTLTLRAFKSGSVGKPTVGESVTLPIPVAGLLSATVVEDVFPGRDDESDAEFLERILNLRYARGWSTRAGLVAMVQGVPEFADAQVSVLTGEHPEHFRDQHPLLPSIPRGNVVDLVVRRPLSVSRTTVQIPATLIALSSTTGTWRLNIGRNFVPGFYEILSARHVSRHWTLPHVTSFDWVSLGKDTTQSGVPWVPYFPTDLSAAFTRFQTAVIDFTDPYYDASSLVLNSTQPYLVTVSFIPGLATLFDHLSQAANRPWNCDFVVRAPVPVFVSMSIDVEIDPDQPPDGYLLRQLAADTVNHVSYRSSFYSSWVEQKLSAVSGVRSVLVTTMTGRLLRPDRTTLTITHPRVLDIPPQPPTSGIGANNLAFFSDPSMITVNFSV